MTAIKTRILRVWDNSPVTVQVCCVKFAQRVVLAQTASINPEPRVCVSTGPFAVKFVANVAVSHSAATPSTYP
jgi:hypothetical protein